MSKREIRAKRLVAAVLLAISVQVWSAPPLWAAEASVQTETSAAGQAKETKDAKAADSETGGEADADEEETVVVPVIGYSTRSAAGSDYGVMPLDLAADGALTGVTGINGSELVVDKVNNNFFIGTIQDGGSFDKSSKNNAAIGLDINVDSNGNSSVFGAAAKSWGESASVFGAGAESGEYGSVFGAGAEASEQYGSAFGAGALAGHSNTVAFGYSAKSTEWYSIAVGAEAKAEGAGGIAIGSLANVGTGVQTYGSGIAIGREAHTNNDLTIALGYNAESTFESSIAVGANSATTAAYQVAFGTGEVKTVDGAEVVTWTDRRSLAGISDIEMAGALTGVTSINGSLLTAMNEDVTNKSLAIGTGAAFTDPYSSVTKISKNALAIGNGTSAGGDGSIAIGYYTRLREGAFAGGIGSIVLNGRTTNGDYNIAIGGITADSDNVIAIGYESYSDSDNAVVIGSYAQAGYNSAVLGYYAMASYQKSVAIGAYSETTEENQVSFGHKAGDYNVEDGSNFTDDLFRSLTNISDIEMHGALTGVTGIDGVTVSGTDASTGLTVGGNAVIGKTDTPFSSTGFAVDKEGAVTAKTVNGAAITSNSFNGVTLEKDASSHYKVGGVDVTKMQTDVAGKAEAATVTALDTRVGKSETDIVTLKTTVGDSGKGLVKDTADLKTAVNDGTTGLAAVNTKVGALEGKTANIGYAEATGTTVDGVAMKAGNIGLGGEWSWNETSKVYESNGKGRLTGLTSINDMDVFFGSDGDGTSIVMGTTLGYNSISVVGLGYGGTIDGESAVYVGNNASALGNYSVAIGAGASAMESFSTALGGGTEAAGENSTAVGNGGRAKAENSVTLGYNAEVGEGHTGSVAVGANSATTAENQVAFGTGEVKTVDGAEVVTWTNRRSLAGISDIDMAGNISLGGEWSWNDAGTSYKSNGLGNLTGVTGINGIEFFAYDCGDGPVLAIGSTIGNDATANSVGLGLNTIIEGYGSVAIGVNTNVRGNDATGVGSAVAADGENSVAVGSNAFATADGATAVGSSSRVLAEGGSALGYGTSVAAAHTNSVAIGAKSATGAANQVSFGHKVGDRNEYGGSNFTDDLFRSLVNVADIEMHGALTGVTGIDGVTVSGTDASTGLTVGGNAVIGKTDTPFSSTGFAVDKEGAVTAKTVNGATITGTGFNGVTLSADGKVNGAAITSNSFNGVSLEKDASSHYKVGGVDVTKMQTDVAGKADAATTLAGYGIADAYTKTETTAAIDTAKTELTTAIGKKADKATTLAGYGIADAYTKTETDTAVGKKVDVTAYDTKMSALDSADNALSGRAAALEGKTANIGYAEATGTTVDGVTMKAGVMTGVASIDGIAVDVSGNLSNAGTYNGVDVSALKEAVDGISADGVGTADTAGIKRDTASATTTIETNTAISSSGITTNAVTASGTVKAGEFVEGSQKLSDKYAAKTALADYTTTTDMNSKFADYATTTAVDTKLADYAKSDSVYSKAAADTAFAKAGDVDALKTTIGDSSGGLVKQVTENTTAIGTKVNADATGLSVENQGKWKTALGVDTLADTVTGNTTAIGTLATAVNDSTTGLAAVNTKVGALDTAYQAADTQIRTDFAAADNALSGRAAALETATTGMTYDADKATTTFAGGVTAAVLTAGELKVGATGFGFGSDGALTAKTVNGIEIKKDESKVKVGGIDLTALSKGDVVTDNTKGIDRNQDTATTTIETNTAISSSGITTNAVTASGTVKAGEFVEGSQKLSDKYAAKTALADYTTTTDMNSKFADYATTTAVDTKLADYTTTTDMNTKLADYAKSDSVYSKAAADTAFAKAGDVDTLKTTIGDSSGGLVKQVTENTTAIGTKVNADATGLSVENQGKWKTALGVDTLAGTVTGNTTAIGTLETAVNDSTTGLAAVNTKVGALDTAYKAADTALSGRAAALETAATGMTYDADKAATTFAGGVTAAVLTAGELKVGATGFGFGSDGALTAKTVNGIEIKKDESKVKVGGIDLTALSKGDVVTDNTKGIDRNQDTATTTIETNTAISSSGITTNAVTASGTVKAGEFVEGSQKLSDKYAAKTALADYTTTTDMNSKFADYATTTAVDTKLADYTTTTDMNTKLADYAKSDSVYSKAAADTAFAKADASNLPSDVGGWQSKLGISDISSKLVDFSYDNASGTTTIGGMKLKGGALADVKSLNGKAVGADGKGITIDGIGLKDLSERVTAIENNGGGGTGGGSTADTEGIKRTDVADGSGKTVIEGATGFTKDGLKTANLEAATAALGGVNFAAGAVTGVSSINGISFADGKLGGVSLSGGKVNGADITSTSFNGVDVKALKNKVDNLTPGSGGGTGGGDNTGGISKPDGDTTNIEGSTSITADGVETNKVTATDSITVADATNNKTTISDKGIVVAEGKKNQVTISEDGIHVGKNSSVVNDTDGFITDKGLYIGVSSSSDISTAKFSVAPNGNLSSKAGDYSFSNTSADGAKFTHSGDTAYGTGSQLDTMIQGNKVTTGRVDTDELYVDGNKVTVAGGTIGQTDAVDNNLEGTDANGNTVTNDFKTSAVNGTTQAAEKTSADGKESTKTVNNTSAGGTSVTTSRTTTDSKDNVTVKESSFGTNEKGMTLSTSNKVTDKDGKVTKDTSGETKMTGDSISVSKTTKTTEKDADGNEKEVTKTSGTTIGSGEVTLKREDGSTIEVGSAIEGMQSDMHELDGRVSRMGVEIKEVGALSAALAGLHPQPENANSRADFAMAMGSYEGKQALAVGGFYRPDKRTMLSIGASTTSSKHMMNMGISIALDRLPEAERRAEESKTDLAGRMKMLEADYESRLEKLEAAYEARLERLEARYARLQEAAEDRKESAAEQPQAEKPAESEVKGDEADRAVS